MASEELLSLLDCGEDTEGLDVVLVAFFVLAGAGWGRVRRHEHSPSYCSTARYSILRYVTLLSRLNREIARHAVTLTRNKSKNVFKKSPENGF